VRRFLSISLLLLFTLPLVSPLFAASTAEANIRACCRRSGKHHCAMSATAQSSANDDAKINTPSLRERCPYSPASSAAISLPYVADPIQTAISADTPSHPICHAQTEDFFRISSSRSHQKRGPPFLILSHS
jgi:hypothetical protein